MCPFCQGDHAPGNACLPNDEAYKAGVLERETKTGFGLQRWPEGSWGYGDWCLGRFGIDRDSLLGSQFMLTGGKPIDFGMQQFLDQEIGI